MRDLASLPARAALQVRALEAGAPALAAAATVPLHLADIMDPNNSLQLSVLIMPGILHEDYIEKGLTLREARLIYEDTFAATMIMASVCRCALHDFSPASPRSRADTRAQAGNCHGTTATAMGFDRRIVWHELLCTRDERAEHELFSMAVMLMLTLCLFVTCPFYVAEGRGRVTAVREAAKK